ncbi:hypothetical protein C8Q76DRAFT_794505 [Earliella scabrosa]|nr:hypothetical protein C8Q76DRAFT_794505 [Earliella scabrosa]
MSTSSDFLMQDPGDPSSNGASGTYRWDDSDDSDVPSLVGGSPQPSLESIPAESPPTGPQRRERVTALEQYMALVVDGRRVMVSIEEQGRGTLVPHVEVMC